MSRQTRNHHGHPLPISPAKRRALAAILRQHPGTSCHAQCERIREALAQFPLTTFEAMRYLDCYDPRARVMQLRNAGEPIVTHWRTVTTESGDRHRVGLYALKGELTEHRFGSSPPICRNGV